MNNPVLSSDSVLETLLNTNRPPTDEEKAIIDESMTPTNAKLKVVEAEISETMAHIQILKSQVEQAEIKLQRLREEESAILETSKDQRRVLSTVRNLPDDVLREIFVACVESDTPRLSYRQTPLPYVLAQISSGMRQVALTSPSIWATMYVRFDAFYYRHELSERDYSILARKTRQWFDRAAGLPLTIIIWDQGPSYQEDRKSNPSSIFFSTLFSYSSRWQEFHFNSGCEVKSTCMVRISALTAVDVPLLQSVSLRLDDRSSVIEYYNISRTTLLKTPTLKNLVLETDSVRKFAVHWAGLTALTLRGQTYDHCHSKQEIARIFQQAASLVSCTICLGYGHSEEADHFLEKITLPYLKTLDINERTYESTSFASGTPSLLDLITAPALSILHIRGNCLQLALEEFFKRSQDIWKLSLPYYRKDQTLTATTQLLRYCPSLTVLSLHPSGWDWDYQPTKWDADAFLQTFVAESVENLTCPLLQYLKFIGEINFSLKTLQLFLEGKQSEISTSIVVPWKRVIIDVRGIENSRVQQQMLDLVSQKKAEGMDVDARLDEMDLAKDEHFNKQ